ncbi:hypothetical protein [Mammaliicoccus vitulinus]|uniref:hypothetical protein n=1 Tax=Mammaliicoccus vitulinus TaxID=71237 RepID=UPI00248A9526|nr:hypothetical protein [Mammaliicoccus vitulinus]
MKKIALKQDVYIWGVGIIKEDTKFRVLKYNKRTVYCDFRGDGGSVALKLNRKDCKVLY